MGAKKIYTLEINGISKNITDTKTLREELDGLNASISRINKNNQSAAQVSKQKSAAVSEEEKEEQRLATAIDKVVRVRTDSNKAIIETNLKAREATREVTREIQVNQLAEGSIKQIGMQLTDLRNKYENLSKAKREDINEGGELLQQIQALDKEYKGLRESTGNFRDSVGNYEKATSGIGKLNESIGNVSQTSLGFAQNLMQTNQLMGLFGDNSEENTERTKNLQKIMLALTIVQGISNTLLKENNGVTLVSTTLSKIHTTQVYARAMAISLATKNTLAATIAQKAFNLVAKANPYVLLAMALASVVIGLANFSSGANTATASGERYKSMVDGVTFATKEARDAHDDFVRRIRDIQIEIDVANGKLTEYQASLMKLANMRLDAYAKADSKVADALKESSDQFTEDANSWAVTFDIFTGAYDKAVKDRAERDKKALDSYRTDLTDANSEADARDELQNAQHNKKIREQNESNEIALKEGLDRIRAERAKEVKDAEKNGYDTSLINKKYDKLEEKEKENLAKKAAEASKAEQDKRKADLEKQKAVLEKELELIRKAEDDKTSLIINEFDRRRAEVDAKYTRQREDLQNQLDTDTNITEKGREAIRAVIANIDAHIAADREKILEDEKKAIEEAEAKRKELLDKRIADSERRNNLLLSGIDISLDQANQKIEEAVDKIGKKLDGVFVRDKKGLELIDVDATRKSLSDANTALDEYMKGVKNSIKKLKEDHEKNIIEIGIEFGVDSAEYEEELQKYADANIRLNANLANANKQREANTKASNEVLTEYHKDLFSKIGAYAQAASDLISSVLDAFNSGLEMQIENLNEQLESVTERYEEVKELREDSTERVEDLEQRLRDATGGTAEALKEQLQDEMHNRAELEREEARLAKEKEKREAEIAKKEKQIKRNEVISNIAQSIVSTAMAYVRALATIPPPLNVPYAKTMGLLGAAQTAIIATQLTKLEDGGFINGPSHVNGGARIQGTNIEVEGGEFVVNKESTAANSRLIEFINSARSTVTATDLVGLIPGESNAPVIINNQNNALDYGALADAMANIHIEPKVAVTDIIDVSDNVVSVRDLAGY